MPKQIVVQVTQVEADSPEDAINLIKGSVGGEGRMSGWKNETAFYGAPTLDELPHPSQVQNVQRLIT